MFDRKLYLLHYSNENLERKTKMKIMSGSIVFFFMVIYYLILYFLQILFDQAQRSIKSQLLAFVRE